MIINHKGYTLVELVVLLVVIGIVATGSVIYVSQSNQNAKIEKGAHRALADIRYAQEAAMSQGRQVNFTITGNSYSASWNDNGVTLSSPLSQYVSVYFGTGEYQGLSITASRSVSFDMAGAPMGLTSDVVMITINSSRSVRINPSGYTYLQ